MARFLHDGPNSTPTDPNRAVRRQGSLPAGMGYNAAIGMGGPLTANPYTRNGLGMAGYQAPPANAPSVAAWHGQGLGGYNAPAPGVASAAHGTQGMGRTRRQGELPSGMGFGMSGYTNQDITALQSKLQPLMSAASGLANQLAQDVQVAGTSYPQGDQNVLAGVTQQVQGLQKDIASAQAVPFTMFSAETGGFAGSDNYYKNTLLPLQSQVQGFADRATTTRDALASWLTSAKKVDAANRLAASQAQNAQNADLATVATARSNATSLANSGNFTQALAALQAPAVTTAAVRLGVDLSGDVGAINAAKTAADANASKVTDNATVQRARTQATALAGQNIFSGALAVLQSQNVTDAASRVGIDLSSDIQAVTGAKQQYDTQQTNTAATTTSQQTTQQAVISCAQAGGQWNGFYCDMTQVNRRQAAQASCTNKGGTWDDASGTCDMTSANSAKVDAAIASANTQAAMGTAAGFNAALGILAGAANAAVASGRQSDIATAQAAIQGQKAQALCASQGGTWNDLAGTCTAGVAAPAATTAAPADAGPPSWIQRLLPSLLAPTPAPAPTYAPAQAPGMPVSYAPAPAGGMSPQQQTILALLQAFGGPQGAQLSSALQGSIGAPTVAAGPVADGSPCSMPDGTPGNYLGGICASGGTGGLGIRVAPASGVTETF